MKRMVEAGLSKRFSVEGLLTELEKIKILILPGGQKITNEVTKKQREILDALNMCAKIRGDKVKSLFPAKRWLFAVSCG